MFINTLDIISLGALILGILGVLVGRSIITFPQKENLTEEYRKKELKKIFRAGSMMFFVGLIRILDSIFNLGH